MTNKDLIFAGITLMSTALSFFSLGKAKKAGDVSERLLNKLNTSLDEIERKTTVEISDELIDTVVSSMTQRKLDRVMPTKVDEAVKEIMSDSKKTLAEEILKKVNAAKPEIDERLRKGVEGVNIDSMKKDVIRKAAADAEQEARNDISRAANDLIDDLKDYKRRKEDDIDDKIEEIMDDLEESAKDKFDEELETLTTRYKSRLDDVSDIYASLASKIGRNV